MGRRISRFRSFLLLVIALSVILPVAQANNVPVTGSYHLIERSHKAGQTRVQLQLHLVNRGNRDLHIRRMTIWDFSHPAPGGSQARSLTVRVGTTTTTQDFFVSQAEYELWKHGTRPRVVLELDSPTGHPVTQVIRLEPEMNGKGK